MRNHEVTKEQVLLSGNGTILEEGWARHPIWLYDRDRVKAPRKRLKEWDYYAITSMKEGWTLSATISDLGYARFLAIAFIDLRTGGYAQAEKSQLLFNSKPDLPQNSMFDNEICYSFEDLRISFIRKGQKRNVLVCAPDLVLPDGRVGLDARIELLQPDEMESMNIATSWAENRRAFFLNEKINCMPAIGSLRLGNDTRRIDFSDDVWGMLNWGRGRWTYCNTWFWSSGSGTVDGHSFGFNLGCGITDRQPASENAVFYDGRIHKIDDVEFCIPDDIMKTWRFKSSDNRFEMEFEPVIDKFSDTNALVIRSNRHQVFGYFTGHAILDDGTRINLDRFPAFAEKIFNRI